MPEKLLEAGWTVLSSWLAGSHLKAHRVLDASSYYWARVRVASKGGTAFAVLRVPLPVVMFEASDAVAKRIRDFSDMKGVDYLEKDGNDDGQLGIEIQY
ncbi:unnamed protein product [Fusarium graminearum]|nr:unnamed protein product [Fusarium graminearum]